MYLAYTHKANYYFFAHRMVLFLEKEIKKHPDVSQLSFNLEYLSELFEHDLAASSTNLDSIMHIVDEYVVLTPFGAKPLVQTYHISYEQHCCEFQLNVDAVQALVAGQIPQYPQVA